MRGGIIETQKRIDGRGTADVRAIVSESEACFPGRMARPCLRAVKRAASWSPLWAPAMTSNSSMRWKAPIAKTSCCTIISRLIRCETGRVGFTGRREIGHGKLAWRALKTMRPSKDEFPYTLRSGVGSDGANGSSSMATVCGSSLAMMDAGVPLKKPVAGIAMGLIKEGDNFAVLSDILGDEDHLGDMDFKVAGTSDGITSLQMDIKITGITEEIMQVALDQAKGGRQHILGEMAKALTEAREEMGEYAPKIETIQVPQDKIREVIGTGGKVVREIVETSGAKIDIGDDGLIKVASADAAAIKSALDQINSIVAEPEVGVIYEGTVVKTMDFGAFVNFFGKRDGLVHISQLADHRVENTTDIVKEGAYGEGEADGL